MASHAISSCCPPTGLIRRLPLVLLAVLVCFQFDWNFLRYLTSEIALRFAELRGFHSVRLGPGLIAWGGAQFEFSISCIFADVFCGAAPLLWVSSLDLPRNLRNIAVFAIALLAFNLLRRCLTDLCFNHGVPWVVVDQLIGGMSYFAVWVCLVRWFEAHEPAGVIR